MQLNVRHAFIGLILIFSTVHVLAQFEKKSWSTDSAVPAIEYTDFAGQIWRSSELNGRFVVINFWATWCAPCTEEMPSLQALQNLNQRKSPVVLTVNFKEAPSKIRKFSMKNGFTLPVIADREGEIAKQWGVKIFPTSIILSGEGKPLWVIEGATDWMSKDILNLFNLPID